MRYRRAATLLVDAHRKPAWRVEVRLGPGAPLPLVDAEVGLDPKPCFPMAPGLRSAPACCAGACRGPSSWFGPTAAPVRGCDVRLTGHGGLPRGRLNQHVDGEPGLNHLCPSYGEFFDHVDKPMRATAGLLARQRAPAEISPVLTAPA